MEDLKLKTFSEWLNDRLTMEVGTGTNCVAGFQQRLGEFKPPPADNLNPKKGRKKRFNNED